MATGLTPPENPTARPALARTVPRLLVLAAVIAALAVAPWYGAREAVRSMHERTAPSGLALNLARVALVLPGMGGQLDPAQTRLAVAFHQLHDGAEFGDLAQQQQRGSTLIQQLQALLEHTPETPAQRQAMALALATAARMPQPPAAQAADWAHWLASLLDDPLAAQHLPPLLHLHMAEALAMWHARLQAAPQAQRWALRAQQAVPVPADIKKNTLENTARSLVPVRVALASCQPGQPALDMAAAQQALAHGFDIRQLRQEYDSGWDRPLLLQAQQAGSTPACQALAQEYQRMLTAAAQAR